MFLYYLLLSKKLQSLAKGVKPGINRNDVYNLTFAAPTLPEQKRIVAILDEAFAGIDKAIANTERNLENARELFESFLNEVFTKAEEDCDSKPMGEIAELIDSLHKTPRYITEGGFPMIRVTDLKGGLLNLKTARRVDQATFEEFSKRHKPEIGDLILSRVGTYGVPVVVETDEPFCLGQNTVFITPTVKSHWLYFYIMSASAKSQIDQFVAGTTQPTISLKNIRSIMVPIPETIEQEKQVLNIQSVKAMVNDLEFNLKSKLKALQELKQSILHKAFSGELTSDPIH